MTPRQSLVRLGGVLLAGAVLGGCAGPRVLTQLTPDTRLPAGAATVLAGADTTSPVRDLVSARLAARGPKAGQTPDYYVLTAQSARPGAIGVMGPGPAGAPPAWVEAPRKAGWRFWTKDKPVRTVSLTVLDAKTGKTLTQVTAADGRPGDRQPLSDLVDAALTRAGLVTP